MCVALNDGQLDAALDDSRTDGVAGEAGGVVDVELLHEVLAVLLDGLDADAEFGRGFLVRPALGDELEHFHLARGELGGLFAEPPLAAWKFRIETVEPPGNGGAEKCFSFFDFA